MWRRTKARSWFTEIPSFLAASISVYSGSANPILMLHCKRFPAAAQSGNRLFFLGYRLMPGPAFWFANDGA